MSHDRYKFRPDSKLALLLPTFEPVQQEDTVMVIARIQPRQSAKATGDSYLLLDNIFNDRAEQFLTSLDDGYFKRLQHDRPDDAASKRLPDPRNRSDALDLVAARLVLAACYSVTKDEIPEGAGMDPDHLDTYRDPFSGLSERALRDALGDAIQALPPIHQDVFYLRIVMGKSQQTTAAMLGLKEHDVVNFTHRCRKALKEWARLNDATLFDGRVAKVDQKDKKRKKRKFELLTEWAEDYSHLRSRAMTLGEDSNEVHACVFNRACESQGQKLPVEDLCWSADGWLTGRVVVSAEQPDLFGFARVQLQLNDEKHSWTSGAFALEKPFEDQASPGARTLKAFLGTSESAAFANGPLALPTSSLELVLAHAHA
jgi:hypothetical protein